MLFAIWKSVKILLTALLFVFFFFLPAVSQLLSEEVDKVSATLSHAPA